MIKVPDWILIPALFLAAVAAVATLSATAAWRGRAPAPPIQTRAWDLTEGTELPGDVLVLQIDREPMLGTVRVLTDQPTGSFLQYRADDLVEVVRLAG